MLTIRNGFITPASPVLHFCVQQTTILKDNARTFSKYSVILSAAIRSSPDLFIALPPGGIITAKDLLSVVRSMPTNPNPLSISLDTLEEVIWNLHFAQRRLLKTLTTRLELKLGAGQSEQIDIVFRERMGGRKVYSPTISRYLGIEKIKEKIQRANQESTESSLITNHLLGLGANVIIESDRSQFINPLRLTLHHRLRRDTTFLLLGAIKSKAEYQLSLAKNKAEKVRLLHHFGTVVAQCLYEDNTNPEPSPVVTWLSEELIGAPSFIFGPGSLNLLDLYRDEENCSAMHIAASRGKSTNLMLMLEMGYPECQRDGRGRTVMDIAVENCHGRVIAMLLNRRYKGLQLKKDPFSSRWSWDVTARICEGSVLDAAMREYAKASARPDNFYTTALKPVSPSRSLEPWHEVGDPNEQSVRG
jgi:hypothetical protein